MKFGRAAERPAHSVLALLAIMHKLGLATAVLANSTCGAIDRAEEAIENGTRDDAQRLSKDHDS